MEKIKKRIVFLYSGQGSQYYNMGRSLYQKVTTFRNYLEEQNDIIKSKLGIDLIRTMYDDEKKYGEEFNDIRYTHPGIYAIEYALTRVLEENQIRPDIHIGCSLGEFCGLTASRAISMEAMLDFVMDQAENFYNYIEKDKGMIAIFDTSVLFEVLKKEYSTIELAGINYKEHFIVSGEMLELNDIMKELKRKKIMYYKLPITYAFHSSLIDEYKGYHSRYSADMVFERPQTTFISSMDGLEKTQFDKEYLWKVIRNPMKYSLAVERIETAGGAIYVDVGPSGTMAAFTKRIITKESESEVYSILTPFHKDYENLQFILEKLKR